MITTDTLFCDLRVYAALLDRFGFILTVNSQWKSFVDAGGVVLPFEDHPPLNYGIGENYLRFCAFADPLSPRLITGVSQLLAGQTDAVSIIYQRRRAGQSLWYMLFGFPHAADGSRAALLHIDITAVYSALLESRRAAATDGGAEGADPGAAAGAVESAVLAAIAGPRRPMRPAMIRSLPGEETEDRQPPLSKRQWQVLSLMTNGMTNVEIARQLGLSPNTVKIHVSGILARLGLPSRTQAVHWALTQGRQEKLTVGPEGA